MHEHLRELWKKPTEGLEELWKGRLIAYRSQPVVFRVGHPTRPDRARAAGYKAKQGFIVARVKVKKGKRKRPKPMGGRKPHSAGRFFSLATSKRVVAEQKAADKYPNMEVIGSYYLAEDGTHRWFEVVLADPSHPSVAKGRETAWISGATPGRAYRGMTAAGRKSRGLLKKGKGAEKLRPSIKAVNKKRLQRRW